MSATDRLSLIQWLSPGFPTGGFAYSHGLEQAMADGLRDPEAVADWVSHVLARGGGWTDAVILSLVLRESALLDSTGGLKAEMFSSELLGRVYAQLKQRHEQGLDVSLAGLTDLTPEEMSHIAGILHRQQGPVNEQALTDCIRTIQNEYQASKVTTEDDLLAVRERMKERKGMKA